MQPLQDSVIIDFFDWMRSQGKLDLVDDCITKEKNTRSGIESLKPYVNQYLKSQEMDSPSWKITESLRAYFIYRYGDKETTQILSEYLSSASLCSEHAIRHNDGRFMSYMTKTQESLNLVIELWKWLSIKDISTNALIDMSDLEFKTLIDSFLYEREGIVDKHLSKRLVYEIKEKSKSRLEFLSNFRCAISNETFHKPKPFWDSYKRYSNKDLVKCIFLPLARDKDTFIKFIESSWDDLNALSNDYLDIYYCEKELPLSGYSIKGKLQSLNIPENVLPCLVLWKNTLSEAQYVELRDLDYNKDVFWIMQTIVNNIKNQDGFATLCDKAKEQSNQLRLERKFIGGVTTMNQTNITITNSSLTGTQVGTTNSTVNFAPVNMSNDLSGEINQAISAIKEVAEITNDEKNMITDLLKEIDTAVKENNKEKQDKSKLMLKTVLKGMGEGGSKIITILSGLANLVKFFGLK